MPPLQPTDYFRAALDLMAEGGASRVTVETLCEALAVTKGSFYHHFDGRPAFVRQVLQHWEEVHGRSLAAEAMTEADPRRRVRVLEELAVGLNHDAERAIRDLSASDAFAAEVLARVDGERHAVVARAVLIGLQARTRPTSRQRVAAVLGQYRTWLEADLPPAP